MKKLLLLLTLSLSIMACQENMESSEKSKYISEENLSDLTNTVKFASFENYESNSRITKFVIATVRLYKKKNGCSGLGVCEACIGSCRMAVNEDDRIVQVPIITEFEDPYLELQLKESTEIDAELLTFEIDEAWQLDADEQTYILNIGEYSFDETIGQFGGYKIPLSVL